MTLNRRVNVQHGVKPRTEGSMAAWKPKSDLDDKRRESEIEHRDRESKEMGGLYQSLKAMSQVA